jgi:transposase-like protein
VHQHLEGKSYRVVAREVLARSGRKISPTSLAQLVHGVALRCKSPWEMSRELRPHWEGFLVLDEKMVPVRGRQLWFYGAFDTSGDVVHWRAVRELTVSEAVAFLQEVKALGYRCRAVVTDLDRVLTRAVELEYRQNPHQYCLKHALASLEALLGYKTLLQRQRHTQSQLREKFEGLRESKGVHLRRAHGAFLEQYYASREESRNARAIRDLRDRCHGVLFAPTEEVARTRLKHFRRRRSILLGRKWKAIEFLERHWDRLMMHHRVKGLPRTNNMAESFNKQIQRRVKTIESFQHTTTATAYMNLLVAYLRFKPYTDCRGVRRHLNGKNRLQAAGLRRTPNDWLGACSK